MGRQSLSHATATWLLTAAEADARLVWYSDLVA